MTTRPPIELTTRCRACGEEATAGFERGRDVRLPAGWDIWGSEVRCPECWRRAERARNVALYVATDLDLWETDRPEMWARDVVACGKAFRRLDGEYLAWLASRMDRAREACDQGGVSGVALVQLELRWERVLRAGDRVVRSVRETARIANPSEPYRPPTLPGGFELPAAVAWNASTWRPAPRRRRASGR